MIEQPAILRVPLLILVAVGTAIVVTQSGVFVYGLSSAALGAAIAGTALVFCVPRIAVRARGARRRPAGVITFTLGSLIILGHFYAELSTTNAALLLLSLTATAAPLPRCYEAARRGNETRPAIMFCLLPLAIAV